MNLRVAKKLSRHIGRWWYYTYDQRQKAKRRMARQHKKWPVVKEQTRFVVTTYSQIIQLEPTFSYQIWKSRKKYTRM